MSKCIFGEVLEFTPKKDIGDDAPLVIKYEPLTVKQFDQLNKAMQQKNESFVQKIIAFSIRDILVGDTSIKNKNGKTFNECKTQNEKYDFIDEIIIGSIMFEFIKKMNEEAGLTQEEEQD